MYSTKNLSTISNLVLLTLFAISFYQGIISPPPLITYTTDENFIGESGIFLLFGLTPRALEWAALPSTLIAYLIFLFWCGFSLLRNLTSIHSLPDILTLFDKNAFFYLNNRESFVLWERWIQLLLVGFILYKTAQFIINSNHPILKPSFKFILLVLCLCSDIIWISVPIIRPEALSGSLFLYLCVRILFTEEITPKIATSLLIIFILSFTQRLIFLFFAPLVIGSLIVHLKNKKIPLKIISNYLGLVFLALLALMPFIITDTFVVLKSFLGGVFIKINHSQMTTFFNMDYINNFFQKPLNVIFSVFCLFGIWFMYKVHNVKAIVIIYLLNFLFVLYSSLKAAQLYETHTFPLSIMAIPIIGFGIYGISAFIKEIQKKWVLGTLGFLLLINSIIIINNNRTAIINQQQNLSDAIAWVKTLENNEKILLSLDFDGLIPKNKPCLFREYEANADEDYRMRKLSNLLKIPISDSISKFTLPILAQSFAFEDEKLFDLQYQIALRYLETDATKRFDTDYFFENNKNMSHCYERKEALNRFDKGKYNFIVSQVQIPDLKPLKTFSKNGGDVYWAYQRK